MSDPAKTPEEIEDVLASVRRLVSDHAPTPNRVANPLQTATEVPSPDAPSLADALVLTPSFRVTDPEDPWVPVAATEGGEEDAASAPDEAPAAEELVAELVTAEAELSETEAAEANAPQDDADWQPDDRLATFDAVGASEEAPAEPVEWGDDLVDETSDEDLADLIRLDGSETSAADFESETGDDNWPEGGAEAALLTLVARREPALEEAEAAAARHEEEILEEAIAEEAAPDAGRSEEAAAHEDGALDVPEVTEVTEAMEIAEADEATTAEEIVEEEAEEHNAPEDSQASEEEADEEVIEEVATDAATDAEADDSVLHAAPIFARHGADEAAEGSVEDLGEAPSPFSFPEAEDGILDEDTLREIIVDVVREELQGVLGQRITRNVRKMVRREIRLALAAEDLE